MDYTERIVRAGNEVSDALDTIPTDVVLAFLATLTETEAGDDDWPELAALYLAIGFYDG